MLVDEAVVFMREKEELPGQLNCGHTRDKGLAVGIEERPSRMLVFKRR